MSLKRIIIADFLINITICLTMLQRLLEKPLQKVDLSIAI